MCCKLLSDVQVNTIAITYYHFTFVIKKKTINNVYKHGSAQHEHEVINSAHPS